MSINASTAGGNSNRPPALESGSYPGRLVLVVDLGLQKQRPYQGEEKSPAREIMLTYEFADEFMRDEEGEDILDKPRWLSESFPLYNLDSERAKSTLRYKALDPKLEHGGDFLKVIGTPVNITVMQNPNKKNPERPWENVGGLTPMRAKDAARAPALVNVPVAFDLEEPDLDSFMALPKWIQKRILENLEFRGSSLERMLEEGNKGAPPLSHNSEEQPDDEEETPY